MITAMMMLFRFNIVNIFRLSCVYLCACSAAGVVRGVREEGEWETAHQMSFCHAKVPLLK